MKGWRITRIPTILDSTENSIDLLSSMRSVLYSISSRFDANESIEIVFFHEKKGEISIYMFFHSLGEKGYSQFISQQLSNSFYQYEELGKEDSESIYQTIIRYSKKECYAVAKNEKLVTTPYISEGYYYWSDPLLKKEDKKPKNLTSIFQTLLSYHGSFISFQLIPTRLLSQEISALQFLSGFLDHRVNNPLPEPNGIRLYEPYALPAYKAYSHYISQINQPFFLYNIITHAPNGSSNTVALQVSSWLKSESDSNPEVHIFSLDLSRMALLPDSFSLVVNNYIMKNCRDYFIWSGRIPPPRVLFRLPFFVSEMEAELFFRLPVDDGVIKGVSGTAYRASNERLSQDITSSDNISFGRSVSNDDIIGASENDFSRHALIVGMPGTGKTTFSVNLLMQFYQRGIPFLAIEPTKAEYRGMIDAIPDLRIYTPGNNDTSPFCWNPFIPPKGISVEKYIPSLFSAFCAAFSMPSPLDVAFLQAIRSTYTRYGWRDYSKAGDPEVTPFGFHEFIIVFKEQIENSNYSRDVKGNLQSGGVLRLSNLINQNRYLFDTINSIQIEDMLTYPSVVELNAIENIEQKALIIAMLLISLGAYVKSRQTENDTLNNVVLVDEAHVLLGQNKTNTVNNESPSPQSFAVQLVENLIAEIRAYGTSVIIADQRPSAVGEAIVANTDIKVVFRLTEKREKDIIADSADFDDSMYKQLSHLDKGQAFVYYSKLYKPQMVQTPDIRKNMSIRKMVSDAEVSAKCSIWNDKQVILKPHLQCKWCQNSSGGCSFKIRADSVYYASLLWDKIAERIIDVKSLLAHSNGIPILLENHFKHLSENERNALIICVRIAFIREAEFKKGIFLTARQQEQLLSSPAIRSNENE